MSDPKKLKAVEFFAGSGLVTEGLSRCFEVIWANDNCPKKKLVYTANFGSDHFVDGSIEDVSGASVPPALLSWASFPCQDLSLAGKMTGLETGKRSALFWDWIRIMDEMPVERRPPVLCLENVVGFLVAQMGRQFCLAYNALRERGYVAGAFVSDARDFTPQSRPRSFLVAVRQDVDVSGLVSVAPLSYMHTNAVIRAYAAVRDPNWKWWKLPQAPERRVNFGDICERNAPSDNPEKVRKNLDLLSEVHKSKLARVIEAGQFSAGTGYKRIRPDSFGRKRQCLEIRFDGTAGCLRTPRGGSSRQFVLLVEEGLVRTRLLTIREAARLMGVRDDYLLPGSYNDAYLALGDAVAVPVTDYIAYNLLHPLCLAAMGQSKTAVGF